MRAGSGLIVKGGWGRVESVPHVQSACLVRAGSSRAYLVGSSIVMALHGGFSCEFVSQEWGFDEVRYSRRVG